MSDRIWYRAKLTPAAQGIYTESFYPEGKKRTGSQYVWFSQEDVTAQNRKVLVASSLTRSAFRMMTLELAQAFLEPGAKATRDEMAQLNELSTHLKV